jgi:hypothetical protein
LCQESESEESAVVAPALDSKRTKQVNERWVVYLDFKI